MSGLEDAEPHEFECDNFWFKDRCSFEWDGMPCGYSREEHIETFRMMIHNHYTRDVKPVGQCPACDANRGGRGGAGRNGDGTWPPTDGRGCPLCGAIRDGGHGGDCPNTEKYDERGNVIR